MNANLWPQEETNPFEAVFERDKAATAAAWKSGVAAQGPLVTFSLLESNGWVVWEDRKGFWSPAPGKATELRRDADLLLSGNDPAFPDGFAYMEDVQGVRDCWPFWARVEQLAPGTCPILTPEQRQVSLRVIEGARRHRTGNGGDECRAERTR